MDAMTTAETREPRLVGILVNNRPVEVPHRTTGAEIKTRAGVPADFELFRVEGDHEAEDRGWAGRHRASRRALHRVAGPAAVLRCSRSRLRASQTSERHSRTRA